MKRGVRKNKKEKERKEKGERERGEEWRKEERVVFFFFIRGSSASN